MGVLGPVGPAERSLMFESLECRTLMSAGGVSVAAGDVNGDGRADTTGNTIYVGSANGGVWKTSNFDQPARTGGAQQIIAVLKA
jgi:hypothetical protein